MYVPEDYSNYHYIVSYGDNYVVLYNHSSASGTWDNPTNLSCIIQYFIPSTITLPYTVSISNSRQFTSINVSDDFYERADAPELTIAIMIAIFFLCFIVNGVTKLVVKGGIFGA